MRDTLEEQLATRLHALGETVHDELPPPADLELQVARRRSRTRAARRWSIVGVAAAVVAAASIVAVVHGTTGGRSSVRIETSPSTAVSPVHDSLQAGTVMLSARGRYVISLDAAGHTNATMIAAEHGDITYSTVTDDHRALWYLSLKKGPDACGDVVRADIEGQSSKIVTRAVAFDVSPDGSRLALYGAGDMAHGQCSPVSAHAPGHIVVLDLAGSTSATVSIADVTGLRWSPDGSYLAVAVCSRVACGGLRRVDVPAALGGTLGSSAIPFDASLARPIRSASIAFGPGGLYVLTATKTDTLYRYDPHAAGRPVPIFSGAAAWQVTQVVPTSTGVYVVAARRPGAGRPTTTQGLYRVEAGRLVAVRSLTDPGTLTSVAPLTAG